MLEIESAGYGTLLTETKGRLEDEALVRGEGCYTDDVDMADTSAGVFLRSPHALATIRGIDVAAARLSPGVIAVITAADFDGANLGTVSRSIPLPDRHGKPPFSPFRPALAEGRVMHVGQPVALVVAETVGAAQDAVDLIEVDYEPHDPVVTLDDAKTAATTLWPEAPGNVAFEWSSPADPDGARRRACRAAIDGAAHVARIEIVNQRIAVVSLEPRVAVASFDAASQRYTLNCGSQGVAGIRMQVAAALQVAPQTVRVLTQDVGGGFGMKASSYPEYIALLAAAKLIGRTIRWVSTRSEAFLSDNQGRDIVSSAELAMDEDGRFLALYVRNDANLGAFLAGVALMCSTLHIANCLPALYDIPHIVVDTACYYSNTCVIAPYRGAGRPEANYLLERVVEVAARQIGLDPAEIRRRNLIPPSRIPYETATGQTYDSGDFPTIFEMALASADYTGFAARRADSLTRGKLRGIGIGCFLEIAGGMLDEPARITFSSEGKLQVSIGGSPSGQGHTTVFTDLVAARLEIEPERIEILFGDSDRDVAGMGAVASRSAMLVGGAVAVACDAVIAKARGLAALLLQASPDELSYGDGAFTQTNGGIRMTLFEVAERAAELVRQGVAPETLDTDCQVKTGFSFPNGCHVAEVEVDAETGEVAVVSYVAVDDCGNVLNGTIVTGQIHGGVAQGLGQALDEHTHYDPASGQLLSASFMDYAIPHATTMPDMTSLNHAVPCLTNPLGTKGTGEAGTTAAPPAIVNAVEHALSPDRSLKLDMPVTALKVWRVLQAMKRPQAA